MRVWSRAVWSRALWWSVLLCPLAGCSDGAPVSGADSTAAPPGTVAEAADALPPWMARHSAGWAQRGWAKAEVGAVWLLRHGGQDALLIDAPRNSQDTLVRLDGHVICQPEGFGGRGNGRCPTVVDAGTTPRLVWFHPANPSPTFGPPPPEAFVPADALMTDTRDSPDPDLPWWLKRRLKAWAREDGASPRVLSVWRLQHKGATAYLVHAGCCDRMNTLYSAYGFELCSPSGGFTGEGDGRCPTPEDPGTHRELVWEHPRAKAY